MGAPAGLRECDDVEAVTAQLMDAARKAEATAAAARADLYANLRARMAAGESAYSLARETGLSQTAIGKIRAGKIGSPRGE